MGTCHSKKHSKLPPTPQSNAQLTQSHVTPNKTSNSSSEMFSKAQQFKQFVERMQLTGANPWSNAEAIRTKSRGPTKPTSQSVQKGKLDAQLIKERKEGVFNAFDGRKQVFTTSKYPYSVHGLFLFKVNQIAYWGTGTMIGPNIVLTAGHNLYSHKEDAYADIKSMQFLPGMNGQTLPFGSVEVEQYFISPNYPKDQTEDYGILILKEPIGETTGYFGLACLKPEEIKKKRINITGYPSDKAVAIQNMYEMWGMEGTVSRIDQEKGLIEYLIDTDIGQGGGGVWYQDGEGYYVCGVHISRTQFAKQATLLTRDMYFQISTWTHQAIFKKSHFKLEEGCELRLNNHSLSAEGVAFLIKYNLNDPTILTLSENNFGSQEMEILAQNTSWTNLSQLNLARNKICGRGVKGLAQNTSWTSLSQLDLSCNQIDSEGVKALAQNTSWISLSELNLSNNRISAEGVKALAQNASWINLSHLNLSWNNIGAEGAKALAQSTTWVKASQSTIHEFKQLQENLALDSIYPQPDAQEIKSSCRKLTKPAHQNTIQKAIEARPIKRKNENVLNAYDQRRQVHNTNKWPYSVHGVLIFKFHDDICRGTGVLIGPNIVLTAGHNLYDFQSKTYADLKTMQFLPGMNGQVPPFGAVEVENYFVSPNYTKLEIEDYGVIILKEPIGEVTGFFGLACLEPEKILKKRINVTGYPADKVASKPKTYEMWGTEGTASSIKKGLIDYAIDTGPGQSGSGVCYQEGEDYYVCGVHVSGGTFVNSATLLTKAIYEKIYTFIQESSFKELPGSMQDSKLNLKGQGVNMKNAFTLNKYNLNDTANFSLFYNSIGDSGAMILAQNTFLSNLSELNLSGSNIGSEGAKALAQNISWINLSLLNLSSNNIDGEGAKALAQNASWINLSELDLTNNKIDKEGRKALRQNKTWKEIKLFL